MPYTEKAGNLLPQTTPELEPFIKAQNHIRAAARLIDGIRANPHPRLNETQTEAFFNLASEICDTLWECYSDTGELLHAQFSPEFPVEP